MRALFLTGLFCLLLLAARTQADQPAAPPAWPQTMPGIEQGTARSTWHAPFLYYTYQSVGKKGLTTLRWFSKEGKVVRELSGPDVSINGGYITDNDGKNLVVYNLKGEGKFVLPRKEGGASGYITSTIDGGTFFHQHHPTREQIAVDVYMDGKLKNTFGPFLMYKDHSMRHGQDGSIALVTWKDEVKKATQVVAAAPGGAVRFKVDCGEDLEPFAVAPDGHGVLMVAANKSDQRTMSFFRGMGKTITLKFEYNPWVVEWVPKTEIALMATGAGFDYYFHLVDWPVGKRLWDIKDPCPARVPGYGPRTAVLKDYFLFAGREYIQDKKDTVRCLYAVDIKTGKTAARWHSAPMKGRQGETVEPQFGKHGDDLYLMTPDEFSLIDVADIAGRKRGWK